MKSLSDFCTNCTLTTIIFLSFLAIFKAEALIAKCPQNSSISPCVCVAYSEDTNPFRAIHCLGPLVTKETVSTAMSALRKVNNVSDNYRIDLGRLSIQETLLEEFDLLPLTSLFLRVLSISNNPKLTSVTFSGSVDLAKGLVEILSLHLENNNLTNSGLQKAFDPLNKASLSDLHMGNNLIEGSQLKNGEFLRGLSEFNKLFWLNLTANNIQRLSGGPFKEVKTLRFLILNGNPLKEISEDAFDLYKQPEYYLSRKIYLVGCGLHDAKFSGKSGIDRNQNSSGIKLFLWENKFETVDEDKFRPFLEAHRDNEVEFDRRSQLGPRPLLKNEKYSEVIEYKQNPIVCDEKLKWLKSKERFFYQINDQACKNDPGKTIFNTKLV